MRSPPSMWPGSPPDACPVLRHAALDGPGEDAVVEVRYVCTTRNRRSTTVFQSAESAEEVQVVWGLSPEKRMNSSNGAIPRPECRANVAAAAVSPERRRKAPEMRAERKLLALTDIAHIPEAPADPQQNDQSNPFSADWIADCLEGDLPSADQTHGVEAQQDDSPNPDHTNIVEAQQDDSPNPDHTHIVEAVVESQQIDPSNAGPLDVVEVQHADSPNPDRTHGLEALAESQQTGPSNSGPVDGAQALAESQQTGPSNSGPVDGAQVQHGDSPNPDHTHGAEVQQEKLARIVELMPNLSNIKAQQNADPGELVLDVAQPVAAEEVEHTLEELAKEHMHKTACTTYNQEEHKYMFHKVRETSPRELGVITQSVGVELYFVFIKLMGVTFVILFFLALPALTLNCLGGMVPRTGIISSVVTMTTVANVGVCPEYGCRSQAELEDRCIHDEHCAPDSWRVRHIAHWIGIFDGVGAALLVAFSVFFKRCIVPRITKHWDMATHTPADYTVELRVLPRVLGESVKSEAHKGYEEALRKHFEEVLRTMKDPIEADGAIARVTLVREYDGAISRFMQKGKLLHEIDNHEVLRGRYILDPNPKKQSKALAEDRLIERKQAQVEAIDRSLHHQAELVDEERPVCLAFITLSKEEYQERILEEYRFAQYNLFRLCQPQRLSFCGHKISVIQACEPTDLYWENLDFSPYKRKLRQAMVFVLTFLVLMVCSALLVSIKANEEKVAVKSHAYRAWVVKNVDPQPGKCLRLCSWDLYQAANCQGTSNSNHPSWNVTRLFDAADDYDPGVFAGESSSECRRPLFESPACNTSAGDAAGLEPDGDAVAGAPEDWVGIQFEHPREVECVQLVQSVLHPALKLQLFGCSDQPPAMENRSGWSPGQECVRMQATLPLTHPGTPGGSGAPSGNLHVTPDTSCPLSKDSRMSLAVASQAKQDGNDVTVDCFCRQQVAADPLFMRPPFDRTPAQLVCTEWLYDQAEIYGRMAAGAVAVLVLNHLLLTIFSYFIALERPRTLTQYKQSQLWKLFLSQFINTALLIYLVNAKLKNLPSFVKIITEPLSLGNGAYFEADASWFTAVGSTLAFTVLMEVMSTLTTPLLMTKVVFPLQRWYARKSGTRVTKETLFEIYEFPEWNLSLRLAQSMNVVCCCIMYSGGMPILNLVGALYCAMAYWMDKYTLLRGSRRPPSYSPHVVQTCVHILPMAAFLHAVFACSVLGNQALFPSEWSGFRWVAELVFRTPYADYVDIMRTWEAADAATRENVLYGHYLQARLLDYSRESCWLLMFICFGLVLFYVGYLVVYKFLLRPTLRPFIFAARELFALCCRTTQSEVSEEVSFEEAEKELKQKGIPSSYTLHDNRAYKAAHTALKHTAERVASEQAFCQTFYQPGRTSTMEQEQETSIKVDS